MWWPQLEPRCSAQKLWGGGRGLYKRVGAFLTGPLGEHSPFPEVGGETAGGLTAGGLRDGSKGGLGEVAQGSSAAPG